VIISILVSVAIPKFQNTKGPKFQNTKGRANAAALRVDLRNLAVRHRGCRRLQVSQDLSVDRGSTKGI
jgi:hypothetical protein